MRSPARCGGSRFIPARAGNTASRAGCAGRRRFIPLARGTRLAFATSRTVSGSSPLARGTPGRSSRGARRSAVHPRSRGEHLSKESGDHPINVHPARAGNTPDPRRRSHARTVHPRSRGEHFVRQQAGIRGAVHPRSRGEHEFHGIDKGGAGGSSPLARGTPRSRRGTPRTCRFIPARAGNTPAVRSPASARSVHPRSRGEHRPGATGRDGWAGSSPLARGTRCSRGGRMRRSRFIPARAGNTPPSPRPAPASPVHPRSRGEHRTLMENDSIYSGSSPLARGTLSGADGRPGSPRFIPARAGNTQPRRAGWPSGTVHPRSRGEHSAARKLQGQPGRFIPARAGNTSWWVASRSSSAVHPRSRGEHWECT